MSLPLITLVGNRFVLNPQAKSHLLTIASDAPIAVLSVVGKYRTGKSFFLNNVIFNSSQQVFRVGPTINPCTKGIWIGRELLTPNSNSQMKVIVLDIEGFGIIDEQDNSDSRIFLFPLLLSSYLVYNSVGNITEQAIRTLGVIVALAREVQLKSHKNEACSYFPAFHWVLRDFTLQLEDTNGNQISSREYLEKALDSQKGITEAIEQKNRIRRNFKQFFVERDCTTLLRPTHSDQDTDTAREFRPEFLEEARITRQKILSSIRSKRLNGTYLTIKTFLDLTESLVEVLNSGGIPNVELAWNAIYTGRERCIILQIAQQLTKLFEDGVILTQADDSEVRREVERYFNSEFQRISMCPQHPSEEVHRLLRQAIASTTNAISIKLKERQSQEAEDQLSAVYRELQAKCSELGSMEQVKEQLSQIRLDNIELFGRLPVHRQFEMESEVKLRCFETLSVRVEISLTVLQNQVETLQHDLSMKSETIANKQRIIDRLQAELERKTLDVEERQKQSEQVRTQLRGMEQHNEHLQLKLRSSESLIISLEATMRNSADTRYEEVLDRMRILDEEVDRLQEALKEAIKRAEELEADNHNLSRQLSVSLKSNGQLTVQYSQQKDCADKLKVALQTFTCEAVDRQGKILQTETRIFKQIEQEESRIYELLKASEIREKQKDLIIEKLERILKQSRRTEPIDHSLIVKLREELEHTRTENELLATQLRFVSTQLEHKSTQLQQLKYSNRTASENVKSSLMNVGLTSKGFEIKSFVMPTSPKQNKSGTNHKTKNPFQKIEKACIDTQLELQAQSAQESQMLIQRLLEREKSLKKEIETLRIVNSTNRQETSHRQTWFDNLLMLAVPAYFVTEVDGRTSTEYQIVLNLGGGQQWTVRRRFKDVCDLRKALIEYSSHLQPPNLYRSTRLEEKRKSIEDFLRACVNVEQYRNSIELKRFLCDVEYCGVGASQRPGSPTNNIVEPTPESHKTLTASMFKSSSQKLQPNNPSQQKQPLQPKHLNTRC